MKQGHEVHCPHSNVSRKLDTCLTCLAVYFCVVCGNSCTSLCMRRASQTLPCANTAKLCHRWNQESLASSRPTSVATNMSTNSAIQPAVLFASDFLRRRSMAILGTTQQGATREKHKIVACDRFDRFFNAVGPRFISRFVDRYKHPHLHFRCMIVLVRVDAAEHPWSGLSGTLPNMRLV